MLEVSKVMAVADDDKVELASSSASQKAISQRQSLKAHINGGSASGILQLPLADLFPAPENEDSEEGVCDTVVRVVANSLQRTVHRKKFLAIRYSLNWRWRVAQRKQVRLNPFQRPSYANLLQKQVDLAISEATQSEGFTAESGRWIYGFVFTFRCTLTDHQKRENIPDVIVSKKVLITTIEQQFGEEIDLSKLDVGTLAKQITETEATGMVSKRKEPLGLATAENPLEIRKQIATKISELAQKHHEGSLREMERITGISNAFLGDVVKLVKAPSLKTLYQLSICYDVPVRIFVSEGIFRRRTISPKQLDDVVPCLRKHLEKILKSHPKYQLNQLLRSLDDGHLPKLETLWMAAQKLNLSLADLLP